MIVILMIPAKPKEGVADPHADLRSNDPKELPGIVTAAWGNSSCNVRVQLDGYQLAPWKTSVPHQSIADSSMLCFRFQDEETTIGPPVLGDKIPDDHKTQDQDTATQNNGTVAGPGE